MIVASYKQLISRLLKSLLVLSLKKLNLNMHFFYNFSIINLGLLVELSNNSQIV